MFKTNITDYCAANRVAKKIKHDPTFIMGQLPRFKAAARKIGVTVFAIPATDHEIMFEREKFEDKNADQLSRNYVYFSERNIYNEAFADGILYLQHDIAEEKLRAFNELIMEFFPGRTTGVANAQDAIKIYFAPQKKIEADKPKQKISMDVKFADKKLSLNSSKCAKELELYLKPRGIKCGYVDSYDMMIMDGRWNVDFNVNAADVGEFKATVLALKSLGGNAVKSVAFY